MRAANAFPGDYSSNGKGYVSKRERVERNKRQHSKENHRQIEEREKKREERRNKPFEVRG